MKIVDEQNQYENLTYNSILPIKSLCGILKLCCVQACEWQFRQRSRGRAYSHDVILVVRQGARLQLYRLVSIVCYDMDVRSFVACLRCCCEAKL